MAQKNWTLDQFKSEISKRSEVKAWILSQEHIQRRERYFMTEGKAIIVDQDRNVDQKNLSLRLMVHQQGSTEEKRQGEISEKLFPALPLQPQIDAAIQAALQTDHKAWELPEQIPQQIPELKTTDPRIAEDMEGVVKELSQRIKQAASKTRPTTFNSAELFVSLHHRDLFLSNGLTYRSQQSRIYTEAAFSSAETDAKTGKTISDEYMSSHWSIGVDQLPIEKIFDETAERASCSLQVTQVQTGKYPVIIDSDVLATLISDAISQLSASHQYQGLPFLKPGSDFIPNASEHLMTITLDPSLAFGADTTALSQQGILQTPLKLVEKNKVLASMTDKQFADYLNLATSTTRGNIVLEAGKQSYSELTQAAPLVLEILQFSGLFTDPHSGTFSSEIRLAKLHDRNQGTVQWIKGGSLSGSVFENFQKLKLSQSTIQRSHFSSESLAGQGYFGPDYALLDEVSIVG